jgi:NAD(P)-dependent dehydrogenase (short-subunit alcohol dehydrogenase family)
MTQRSPVVLITGTSSGIGRAIASAFAAKGFEVFGTSRNPQRNEPIAGVELLPLDVSDQASVASAVSTVLQRAGRIDVLVNNAGVGVFGAAEESSIAQAQELFDTNFFGLIRVTNEVLPHLRAQRSGRIINISSVLGFLPAPYGALYAASKHAVEGYSESLVTKPASSVSGCPWSSPVTPTPRSTPMPPTQIHRSRVIRPCVNTSKRA